MSAFFVHLGMNKTGTTAIQKYFHRNRDKAQAAGIVYPPLPEGNHSATLDVLFNPDRAAVEQKMARTGKSAFVAAREDLRHHLEGSLAAAAAAGRDVLVSGETIPFMGEAGMAEIRAFGEQHVRSVIALALVRPPLAFARSSAQERIKGGLTLTDLSTRAVPVPVYRTRFEPALRAFGPDRVRLRPFHRSRMVEGDVLPTLLAMMGGDRTALAGQRAPRSNESMSLTGAKFLSALNDHARTGGASGALPEAVCAVLGPEVLEHATDGMARRLATNLRLPKGLLRRVLEIPGPPFALPMEAIEKAMVANRADVAWMSERLGEDITALDDRATAGGPALADLLRFSAEEIDAIVGTLKGFEAPARTVDDTARRAEKRRSALVQKALAPTPEPVLAPPPEPGSASRRRWFRW